MKELLMLKKVALILALCPSFSICKNEQQINVVEALGNERMSLHHKIQEYTMHAAVSA